MAYNIVKINKARCRRCSEILISNCENKEESCGCGFLKIGGGHSWIKRNGKSGVDYDELSVLNFQGVPDNIADSADQQEQEKDI